MLSTVKNSKAIINVRFMQEKVSGNTTHFAGKISKPIISEASGTELIFSFKNNDWNLGEVET